MPYAPQPIAGGGASLNGMNVRDASIGPSVRAAHIGHREHVPKKLLDFFDKDMLLLFEFCSFSITCFHVIEKRARSIFITEQDFFEPGRYSSRLSRSPQKRDYALD
jgi:hypothetical protein